MKLILTTEVSGLGTPGDIVEVKDGYGRNYLIPRGFAIRWTRGAESQIASIKKARDAREIRDLGTAKEVAGQLGALKVKLKTRAGEAGRLFGSVTTGDIADAVKAAGGPQLDRRRIEIGNAIKSLGTHRVSVKLHPEVAATVEVEIVAG
ncbi:50S ribosomal protein L9 [Planotetraspora phitsanulokensis]|uniref:Large ribosomal subunit protein bL9 n=1 Tax=Planotetraspora phitsanulokensis TaxID=575192 RepID=A0A8J3XGB8_9ACTN|nr:50S ribosomal protein L9 [Planotetraspora phitsanulokensis]GII39919.1 50S ribosomal protein L9 [Planotetraspora phitsanulokensis]